MLKVFNFNKPATVQPDLLQWLALKSPECQLGALIMEINRSFSRGKAEFLNIQQGQMMICPYFRLSISFL